MRNMLLLITAAAPVQHWRLLVAYLQYIRFSLIVDLKGPLSL